MNLPTTWLLTDSSKNKNLLLFSVYVEESYFIEHKDTGIKKKKEWKHIIELSIVNSQIALLYFSTKRKIHEN